MEQYQVRKLQKPISCQVEIPGSKSITNRALLLAAMADGESTLRHVLFSDDSRAFLDCLEKLGFELSVNEKEKTVRIKGGRPCPKARINVRSAGTTARFLTAFLAASGGEYEILSSEQMAKRPMKPLCEALEGLGMEFTYHDREYFLPFNLKSKGCGGGTVSLFAEQSSQFLSALLMTGHLYEKGLQICHTGTEIARSYIDMTIKMIEQFGGSVVREGQTYRVLPSKPYRSLDYRIEPDVSGAGYFFAMAVLTGGEILVKDVHLNSLQGDIQFLEILKRLGAHVTDTPEGVKVSGPANGSYNGIDVDMNDCSDQTMTLAALAVFAKSPTVIRNIGHIRLQESDRLFAIATELKKLGIKCEEGEDSITIYPGEPQPALIDTYHDHRLAMAFSLIGLKSEGIVINDPGCTAKTFENYFALLDDVINDSIIKEKERAGAAVNDNSHALGAQK